MFFAIFVIIFSACFTFSVPLGLLRFNKSPKITALSFAPICEIGVICGSITAASCSLFAFAFSLFRLFVIILSYQPFRSSFDSLIFDSCPLFFSSAFLPSPRLRDSVVK